MKKVIAIFSMVLICLTMVPVVSADVIDPGQKEVALYYQITNINSYTNYVFLLHGNPSPSFMVLDSTDFNFYKLSTASIYAVKKSYFNQTKLEKMTSKQLDNYFTNNTNVIASNIKLKGGYGSVNLTNSLNKVVIQLEITSLNQNNLEIKKTRAKYFYTDGSTKTADFIDQNTIPTPNTSFTPMDIIWYFFVPLIAVVAILLVMLRR